MKMRQERRVRLALAVGLTAAALALGAWTNTVSTRSSRAQEDGGGGEIPTPFDVPNQRAELADGEHYLLMGRVVPGPRASTDLAQHQQQAWFQPDFDAHPWLATAKRLASPGYPIARGGWSDWSRYAQAPIRLSLRAKGRIVYDRAQGTSQYVIFLEPVGDTPVESVELPSAPVPQGGAN
jgi:hypothetical protein